MNISEDTHVRIRQFHQVRQQTVRLTENLSAEDMTAQSMPDASPTKWHLAHTTWFFETFLLQPHYHGYHLFHPQYQHLFNSYYTSIGSRHPRPQRGILTRPGLQDVLSYRDYVDEHLSSLIERNDEQLDQILTVGLHHEMQHQELLLTDILHLLSLNPLLPAINPASTSHPGKFHMFRMKEFEGGLTEVGDNGGSFSYDCERPSFKTFLTPFSLSSRLITNGEWLEFIKDQGYQNSLLWLSDGWDCNLQHKWSAPLYWHIIDGEWFEYSFNGLQPLNKNAPVCHISYYEADAFARWAGKRLPREHELEHCAQNLVIEGNLLESKTWQPATSDGIEPVSQIYGDVWEWTQSAFLPYPKFNAEQGALGEYNGKFMANQMVLKGGSCVTPRAQLRPSYRNFFYPHQRWQFSGLRLADDI